MAEVDRRAVVVDTDERCTSQVPNIFDLVRNLNFIIARTVNAIETSKSSLSVY